MMVQDNTLWTGRIDPHANYVAQFAAEHALELPNIEASRALAFELRGQLRKELSTEMSSDYDLVVFGSLARDEWTSGSDVDWTLLIDGQASSDHRGVTHSISTKLGNMQFRQKRLPKPGREGAFGHMTFSHDLIHYIGGDTDTNRNTTKRILLLLESCAVSTAEGGDASGPLTRVIHEILLRYLRNDTICLRPPKDESRIPRFLLNDIVRFWRTMCVDFAYKEWEQAGEKWALRNVKLRVSRKLLFVSGLLMVFSCYRNPALVSNGNADAVVAMMQEHLLSYVQSSPLNILVWSLRHAGMADHCGRLLACYDQFLAKLTNDQVRSRLESLAPAEVYHDADYLECHHISDEFQNLLNQVFFRQDSALRQFIFEYGVF
jgi:Nucleotidyltransferase domain